MAIEEAINIIKELIDTYITCHGEEDTIAVSLDNIDIAALHMAIEALEQEQKSEEMEFGIRMSRSEKTVYLLGNDSKAIQEVISTVQKYKKIQEIMDNIPDDAKSNSKALGDIEVVMSCNVDNNQSEKEYLTTFCQPH